MDGAPLSTRMHMGADMARPHGRSRPLKKTSTEKKRTSIMGARESNLRKGER